MKKQATIFVRPAEGMRVRDPVTMQVLPLAGAEKPRNSYWERRVMHGDCVEGPLPVAEAAKPKHQKRTDPEAKE